MKKEEDSPFKKIMISSVKRIIKSGYKSFARNIGLSAATVFVMLMVIFMITFLAFLNPISEILISSIKEKIDMSVYFEEGVKEEDVLKIKEEIINFIDVSDIEYITAEMALERFTERHKENPVIIESLEEIGSNPFLSSLNIKAKDALQYEEVNVFLKTSPFKDLINKVDYYERRPVIEKVFSITDNIAKVGLWITLLLGVIAILIAFSTIRTAIYNSKEEISIMRLVGASNGIIGAPFVVQGAIVGFFAAVLALLITFLSAYFLNARIESFFPGTSVFEIFISNFNMLLLIQFSTGIGLGVISSLIAVRKHLNV